MWTLFRRQISLILFLTALTSSISAMTTPAIVATTLTLGTGDGRGNFPLPGYTDTGRRIYAKPVLGRDPGRSRWWRYRHWYEWLIEVERGWHFEIWEIDPRPMPPEYREIHEHGDIFIEESMSGPPVDGESRPDYREDRDHFGRDKIHLNEQTGNLQFHLPLVSWRGRGLDMDFTLTHNSIGQYFGEFGNWGSTFCTKVGFRQANEGSGGVAFVRWSNGLRIPYASSNGYTFERPSGTFDKLFRNQDGTWRLETSDELTYSFNNKGFLTRIADQNGNTLTIARGTQQRIQTVTDSTGRQLIFGYSGRLVTSITDHTGRSWLLGHNNFQLTQVSYPLLASLDGEQTRRVRTFTYEPNTKRLASHTDLIGATTNYLYHEHGRLWQYQEPVTPGNWAIWTWNYTNQHVTERTPEGREWVTFFTDGRMSYSRDASAYERKYVGNADGLLTELHDERGRVWRFTWDALGNLLTSQLPSPINTTVTYTYHPNTTRLWSIDDGQGNATSFVYDDKGNLEHVIDPLGRKLIDPVYPSTGNHFGLPSQWIDRLGRTIQIVEYDQHGNAKIVRDPDGLDTTTTYDNLSRPTSVTDRYGNTYRLQWDEWDRLRNVQLDRASGADPTRIFTYDAEGRLTSLTNEAGHTENLTYDLRGLLASARNFNGHIESYGYDGHGWLTSVLNAKGELRTLTYSPRGELKQLNLPDGVTHRWSYSSTGLVTIFDEANLPDGASRILYRSDEAGRLSQIDFPFDPDVTFGYDASGRLASMQEAGRTATTWSYNDASELIEMISPEGTVRWNWEDTPAGQTDYGRLLSVEQVGVGTMQFGYADQHGTPDPLRRLRSVSHPLLGVTRYEYDPFSRLAVKRLSNGSREEYAYDDHSRPWKTSVFGADGAKFFEEELLYTDLDQIAVRNTNRSGQIETATYLYDPNGQLMRETRCSWVAMYTYDPNGNRTWESINGTTRTFEYGPGDRLLRVLQGFTPVETYTYDSAGRPTLIQYPSSQRGFVWRDDSRLKSTQATGEPIAQFVYNGLGAVVQRSGDDGNRSLLRAGGDVTSPLLFDGATSYLPGVGLSHQGQSRFLHSGLKSIEAQSDASGSASASRQSDAFGRFEVRSGDYRGLLGYGGAFGYQSLGWGNLMLLGHRVYNPTTGRFLTRDPIYDGTNWYRYANGDPVALADPDGQLPVLLLAAAPAAKKFIVGGGLRMLATRVGTAVANSGARARLVRASGVDLVGYHAHHVIPRNLFSEIMKRFPNVTHNFLESAKNLVWWEARSHLKNSRLYEQRLRAWLQKNPKASFQAFMSYARWLANNMAK